MCSSRPCERWGFQEPSGFINQSRYLPDRRDLNRCFPGSEKGSLASRLAHVFLSEIAALCTHGIDLHTGAIHRDNLPQVRACTDDPETMRMARAFDAPVLINTALVDGSIRRALARRGIPIVVYEAGEALRFDEVAIRIGVHGVLSVMRYLRIAAAPAYPAAPHRTPGGPLERLGTGTAERHPAHAHPARGPGRGAPMPGRRRGPLRRV